MPERNESLTVESFLAELQKQYETSPSDEAVRIAIPVELVENNPDGKLFSSLETFLQSTRLRLFLFQWPDDADKTAHLAAIAKRAYLTQYATTALNSSRTQRVMNPLKRRLALSTLEKAPNVLIQKTYELPQSAKATFRNAAHAVMASNRLQHATEASMTIEPVATEVVGSTSLENIRDAWNKLGLQAFLSQLEDMGVTHVQSSVMTLMQTHAHVFHAGIVSTALPYGIHFQGHTLCYDPVTEARKLAFAPTLEPLASETMPAPHEQAALTEAQYNVLMNETTPLLELSKTLQELLGDYAYTVPALRQTSKELVEPVLRHLAKAMLVGGAAYTRFSIQLLQQWADKKLPLNILMRPEVSNALLTTRGAKHLQKLLQLPAEQQHWWIKLVQNHVAALPDAPFDFNGVFETYFYHFLPKLADKKIRLPSVCPIHQSTHALVTMKRVLDVLLDAENPHAQALMLEGLDWGPQGVHAAMAQAEQPFKQVAACMQLHSKEARVLDLAQLFEQLPSMTPEVLETTLYRYCGQHWKAIVSLADLRHGWTMVKRSTLVPQVHAPVLWTVAMAFASEEINATAWPKQVENFVQALQCLPTDRLAAVIQAFAQCFTFASRPSLTQLTLFCEWFASMTIEDDAHLSAILEGFVRTLQSPQGMLNFQKIQQRVLTASKRSEHAPSSGEVAQELTEGNTPTADFPTAVEPEQLAVHDTEAVTPTSVDAQKIKPVALPMAPSNAIASFLNLSLHTLGVSDPHFTTLCAVLEGVTTQTASALWQSCEHIGTSHSALVQARLLSLLSQLNLSKSPALTMQQLQQALSQLGSFSSEPTIEACDAWLKAELSRVLPDHVFGSGEISQLSEVLADAIAAFFEEHADVLHIPSIRELMCGSKGVFASISGEKDGGLLSTHFDNWLDTVEVLQRYVKVHAKTLKFEEIIPFLKAADEAAQQLVDEAPPGKDKEKEPGKGKGKGYYVRLCGTYSGHGLLRVIAHGTGLREGSLKAIVDSHLEPVPQVKEWLYEFEAKKTLTVLFHKQVVGGVVQAFEKMMNQLGLPEDVTATVLAAVKEIPMKDDKGKPLTSADGLCEYEKKVATYRDFLNVLGALKTALSSEAFRALQDALNRSPLKRLGVQVQTMLLTTLFRGLSQSDGASWAEQWAPYLQLTVNLLDGQTSPEVVARAMAGAKSAFEIAGVSSVQRQQFYQMCLRHGLCSPSPFPLSALRALQNMPFPGLDASDPQQQKTAKRQHQALQAQVMQCLEQMTAETPVENVRKAITLTQTVVLENPAMYGLCMGLLKRMTSEQMEAYITLVEKVQQLEPTKRSQWLTILTALAQSEKDHTATLTALLSLMTRMGNFAPDVQTALLKQMESMFAIAPYPAAERFVDQLKAADPVLAMKTYCEAFDLDPFATDERPKRCYEVDFATDRVQESIRQLQFLMRKEPLSAAMQLKLTKQLTYIETLGYTDSLRVSDDLLRRKGFTHWTRQALIQEARALLDQSRDAKGDLPEKAQLRLLALMREVYFRATGLFPKTSQMLALLLALQYPQNLLMQIPTGEGKSIITAMLAVFQWARGGTVDVWTANTVLLNKDYPHYYRAFFTAFKIPSNPIYQDSDAEAYQINGINCSTLEEMAFFRMKARENSEWAKVWSSEETHTIADEGDAMLFDLSGQQIRLVAFVKNKTTVSEGWIYEALFDFIEQEVYRNLDPATGWDVNEDAEHASVYLDDAIQRAAAEGKIDAQQALARQKFLTKATTTQLRQWLNATVQAKLVRLKKHFVVKSVSDEGRIVKVAVPVLRGMPKEGYIFADGVQAALHVRLGREKPEETFLADVTPSVVASQSASGMLQESAKSGGRFIAITGTAGNAQEIQVAETAHQMLSIGFAPHAGVTRVWHPPVFVHSQKERWRAVRRIVDTIRRPVLPVTPQILQTAQELSEKEVYALYKEEQREKWPATQTPPVLLLVEDLEEAEALYAHLVEKYQGTGLHIRNVTGEEKTADLETLIDAAGKPNQITIGTAMLGRGVDIKPGKHPTGLVVVQTFIDSERITAQGAGRSARNGWPGHFYAVYEVPKLKHWWQRLFAWFSSWFASKQGEAHVQQVRQARDLEMTLNRLYTEAVEQVQAVLMKQVEAWEALTQVVCGDELGTLLYQWRSTLFGELQQLQASEITDEATLQTAILDLQAHSTECWERLRALYWEKKVEDKLSHEGHETPTSSSRTLFEYLKTVNLSDLIASSVTVASGQIPSVASTSEIDAATQALCAQNIQIVVDSKATVYLEYERETLTSAAITALEASAVSQGILGVMSELCGLSESAFDALSVEKEKDGKKIGLRGVLANVRALARSKQELAQDRMDDIRASYLANKLQLLTLPIDQQLKRIEGALIQAIQDIAPQNFADHFKMYGVVKTLDKLMRQTPDYLVDAAWEKETAAYGNALFSRLAKHIMQESAWAVDPSPAWYTRLERKVSTMAVASIYEAAKKLFESQTDEEQAIALQQLYALLQKERLHLKDIYGLSIGHKRPSQLIQEVIQAIDSLREIPGCHEPAFREIARDEALIQRHIEKFRQVLKRAYIRDPNLRGRLESICQNEPVAFCLPQLEAVLAEAKGQLLPAAWELMQNRLQRSMKKLNDHAHGIQRTDLLDQKVLVEKAKQLESDERFAGMSVQLRRGGDGLNQFIEISMGERTAVDSHSAHRLTLLKQQQRQLEANFEQLNPVHGDLVPEAFRDRFMALCTQKQSLQNATTPEQVLAIVAAQFPALTSHAAQYRKLSALKASKAEDWQDSQLMTLQQIYGERYLEHAFPEPTLHATKKRLVDALEACKKACEQEVTKPSGMLSKSWYWMSGTGGNVSTIGALVTKLLEASKATALSAEAIEGYLRALVSELTPYKKNRFVQPVWMLCETLQKQWPKDMRQALKDAIPAESERLLTSMRKEMQDDLEEKKTKLRREVKQTFAVERVTLQKGALEEESRLANSRYHGRFFSYQECDKALGDICQERERRAQVQNSSRASSEEPEGAAESFGHQPSPSVRVAAGA